MIRARVGDGTFLFGLDDENINRLTNGQPIWIDLAQLGGTGRLVIMHGHTKAAIMKDLESMFGPLPPAQPLPPGGDH